MLAALVFLWGVPAIKTGRLFAFFSPLLGWLGVALTGSDTSALACLVGILVLLQAHILAGMVP